MSASLYIASTITNWKRVRELRDQFAVRGVCLTYDWTEQGYLYYLNHLENPERDIQIAQREVAGVIAARCLLLVTPAREGAHFEAGLALGRNIPIVLLNEVPPDRYIPFHQLPSLIQCATEAATIDAVLKVLR